ncbi:hypothetical protein NIES4071_90530 [Calothrix sp. NIES-4071]|nr:hypothetical protein NIES4071_90530 [Calothrix sp. NIES-4071]BAZ63320.1 hypothetical protein NIES4105_90460 [Calothrix sp. NIES-4105]
MRRRQIIKLASGSVVGLGILHTLRSKNHDNDAHAASHHVTNIKIDWESKIAETTPLTFGSNNYEITDPKTADSAYKKQLQELNIQFIRIHNAELSEAWTDSKTKTWDLIKVQTVYDTFLPQQAVIVQNISSWPGWMAQDKNGLLNPSEYDKYAAFCAQLVELVNLRLQKKVVYWEPLNEQDTRYEEAGKLDQLWIIYNKVASAMKAVDSSIKVGGPALTWDEPNRLASFLQACKPNVDFVSWHRYATGDVNESTDSLMSKTLEYGEQVRTLREVVKQNIPERSIPLLLGEYNINYSWESGENRQNTNIGAVWFASILKHLAEAAIEMAASWNLKDGIYGMIDPENNLRPGATVFKWAIKYLTGTVVKTVSDYAFVEALAVKKDKGTHALLLINKSSKITQVNLDSTQDFTNSQKLQMFTLDEKGVKDKAFDINQELILTPYSLALITIH